MEIKKLIKKILCNACIMFTAVTLIYMLAVVFINVDDTRIMLDALRVFLFLVFSLLWSIANSIFKLDAISRYIRFALHYVLCGIACYLCLLLPTSPRAAQTIIGIVIYSVIYFAVSGIVALFRSRYRKQSTDKTEYTKRFS